MAGAAQKSELENYLGDMLERIEDLQAVLVTDRDGVPLVQGVLASTPDAPASLTNPNFLVTAVTASEQASKLGLGANKALLVEFDGHLVVHFNNTPLMINVIAGASANRGLLLSLQDELTSAVEPLRKAFATQQG